MFTRCPKLGVFLLEGSNSYAATCFLSYFFFFMHRQFGFTNRENLIAAAASGLVYVPAAFWGGKFAQRAGYFMALRVGFIIMLTALVMGWLFGTAAAANIVVMLFFTAGMCFIWPTLEALASEGETRAGLQHNVGIYNVVWAATNALAYFTGGAILDKWGANGFFLIPIVLVTAQLALTFYLQRRLPDKSGEKLPVGSVPHPAGSAKTQSFMRMSWLANPFAYIAINTLIAVMPGVADRLNLSATSAGLYCSLWCFARLGTFVVLWFWDGWHYRFRWLLAAFLALVVSFTVILVVPHLAAVVLAEFAFGGAIGLIYYSSLYYSMDLSDTKGEHGGIHEAAIGLGNFAGPALGAASLFSWPGYANSGALAVSVLMVCGLGGLFVLRRTS